MRTLFFSRLTGTAVLMSLVVGCRDNPMPDAAIDTGVRQDTNVADRPDAGANDTGTIIDTGFDPDVVPTEAGPASVTIRQIQDVDAAGHPDPSASTFVTLSQTGMVALSPRLLIRDPDGPDAGSGRRCYMGVWVGDPTNPPFSGIQVQELVRQRDAGNCFEAEFRIPKTIMPGDRVLLVPNANYTEFCASSGSAMPCAGMDQSQLFGPDDFQIQAGTTAPTPADVTLAQVGGTNGAAGPETVAREGTLVRLQNVKTAMGLDGTISFNEVYETTTGPRLTVDISNINFAGTLRTCWTNQPNATVSVTGILFPSFSRWRLKVRTVADVTGLTCATGDAGVPTDTGASDGSGG